MEYVNRAISGTHFSGEKSELSYELRVEQREERLDESISMALWESIVVVLVLFIMLLSLFFELAPAYIIMLTALVAVWDMGIISTDQALSGFSNSSMITVASLFVIAQGVEKSHLIERMALKVFGDSGKTVALVSCS